MKIRVDSVRRREGSRQVGTTSVKGDVVEVGVTPVLGGAADSGIAGTIHLTVPTGGAVPVEEGKTYSVNFVEAPAAIKPAPEVKPK